MSRELLPLSPPNISLNNSLTSDFELADSIAQMQAGFEAIQRADKLNQRIQGLSEFLRQRSLWVQLLINPAVTMVIHYSASKANEELMLAEAHMQESMRLSDEVLKRDRT